MDITEKTSETGGQYFEVKSESGATYSVTFCGTGDGDPDVVRLWKCDCPAGTYGRDCKHVAAVVHMLEQEDD